MKPRLLLALLTALTLATTLVSCGSTDRSRRSPGAMSAWERSRR